MRSTILITGASSRLGAGMARQWSSRGRAVGLCARRVDRLHGVFRPTVVADGVVVATWTRPRRGRAVVVEPFEAADPGFTAAVEAAAVCLP